MDIFKLSTCTVGKEDLARVALLGILVVPRLTDRWNMLLYRPRSQHCKEYVGSKGNSLFLLSPPRANLHRICYSALEGQ